MLRRINLVLFSSLKYLVELLVKEERKRVGQQQIQSIAMKYFETKS